MGRKSRLKKEYRESLDESLIEHKKWRQFLKEKCHYHGISYLVLCYFSPFVFISNFDVEMAYLLIGCTWFIVSLGYFLIFRLYAKAFNEKFYCRLLKNKYGDGSGVARDGEGLFALFAFRHSMGMILLMGILGLMLGTMSLFVEL